MNENQIRKVAAKLREQASILENSLPELDLSQVDYEPQFELGTRYIKYIGEIRHIYRYVKIVAGVVGHTEMGEELRSIHHRWI